MNGFVKIEIPCIFSNGKKGSVFVDGKMDGETLASVENARIKVVDAPILHVQDDGEPAAAAAAKAIQSAAKAVREAIRDTDGEANKK